jgi:GT2 family glycosyltransferase/2-polyprenyl-3-methyl-5-hydroxy-6-metoxy-1,4-benzoquinol methylase
MQFTGERFIPADPLCQNEIMLEHFNRYHAISQSVKNKRVLDAACGSGYGSGILAETAIFVNGIDISEESIDYAKNNYSKPNVLFDVGSIDKLPFENDSFDYVISFETIEHVNADIQERFLQEVKRVLDHNGKLIISTPDKKNYSDNSGHQNEFHIKEFYTNEFQNFLKSHFKYVVLLFQRNEICNVISGFECDTTKVIRKKYIDSTEGKYIIAICSDSEITSAEMTCASIEIQTGELENKIRRIIELQNEVEVKNNWAFNLNNEINQLRVVIQQEREICSDLKEEILNKDEIITNERSSREILAEALEKLQVQLEEKAIEYQSIRDEQDSLINQLRNDFAFVQETLDGKSKESEQLREEIEAFNTLINQERTEHTIVNNTMAEALEKLQVQLEEKEYKNIILEKQLELMKYNSEKNYIKANNNEAFSHLRAKYKKEITDRFMDNFLKSKIILLKPLKIIQLIMSFKTDLSNLESRFNKIPKEFLEQFDSGKYLETNKDVKLAVENNQFENAVEHFIFYGFEEVRGGVRPIYNSVGLFHESEYLRSYADVDAAVKRGDFKTAYDHFVRFGCFEISRGSRIKHHLSSLEDYKPILIDPQSVVISYNTIVNVPLFADPLVSIIVPAYNQANYTVACIQSIVANTTTVPYEIILMDDKSPDEDARNLKYFINNITFISNEENLGFLRNCNKGAALANGKYILFLNNDTNVQPNWLDSLVDLIESDESIGMVGSRLVYPDGRQQEAGGIIWNDASGWNFGRLDDPSKPEYNYVKEVDYISGAAVMLSKELWDEIGGFDERFIPAYYEDTDLAFEVRKHGYKVMYQPKSIVIHFEGISNGTDLGSGIKKYQVINYEKFFSKWKHVLQKDHFPNAENVFQARDRSRYKKSVLFVDHYLPHYDQDAGSKAAYQYLRMLVSNGMNVKFIGDNFYNYPDKPYLEALQQMGIEVLYGNWYYNNWKEWLVENAIKFDFFILSRPHIAVKYIDIVKGHSNGRIIYFGHDLHFLREEREYLLKKDVSILHSSEKWKTLELELMKKADFSYYFSDIEADEIKKNDPSIDVDVVPLYIFDTFKENHYMASERNDIMFVGGFGHSPNVDAMRWFVTEVWDQVVNQLKGVKLYIIGSNPPDEIIEMATDNIIVTGFISDQKLEEYFSTCRIMVAPLRYGAGVKGKIVQALYEGMPTVTTSIGAEGLIQSDECLIVQNDAIEMADKICELYNDKEKLRDLSLKSSQYCENFFSATYAKKSMKRIFIEKEN